MNIMQKMELFKNLELSSRFIENIRIHLDNKHRKKRKNQYYVLEWPRSQKRYIDPEIYQYLLREGIKELVIPPVKSFLLPKDTYNEVKSKQNSFDNVRFKVIRNYYAIERLKIALTLSKGKGVDIIMEHRSTETPEELFEAKKTVSIELIEKIRSKEELSDRNSWLR